MTRPRRLLSVGAVDGLAAGGTTGVKVEGLDTPVEVSRTAPGRYRVRIGARRFDVTVARSPAADWGAVDGQTFRWPIVEDVEAAPATEGTLTASTPGTVTAVKVAAGDLVTAGDTLVTLEAMKMEMPIRAPHAGRVAAVRCAVGDQVQPGVPLVELAGR